MKSCREEESYKVALVSESNTVADPGTVVVVDFYTDSTQTAVKGPGGAQVLAGVAEGQFIMLVSLKLRVQEFLEGNLLVFDVGCGG